MANVPTHLVCPHCGNEIRRYRNPFPTVDVIIRYKRGIVLIERKNPPPGWAIPGGFIDYGESAEEAAAREMREETGLELEGLRLFTVRSDPDRDPRFHTVTIVFTARGAGRLHAGDDAARARVFPLDRLPETIAFDHREVLELYRQHRPDRI
ncbi:MAG TPA: NUDIX hydrolase [Bacteroidetes bacterium]|nr:NUDIX hydrolase [Bacteroidota bacterium]